MNTHVNLFKVSAVKYILFWSNGFKISIYFDLLFWPFKVDTSEYQAVYFVRIYRMYDSCFVRSASLPHI